VHPTLRELRSSGHTVLRSVVGRRSQILFGRYPRHRWRPGACGARAAQYVKSARRTTSGTQVVYELRTGGVAGAARRGGTVLLRGARRTPRSSMLIAWTLSPDGRARSSCVRLAVVRKVRRSVPKSWYAASAMPGHLPRGTTPFYDRPTANLTSR